MTKDDEWIRAAMTDESMVAELLLRLKQSYASHQQQAKLTGILPPLRWGIRQPRSRMALRCEPAAVGKDGEPTRCSPTTPLSWSGGTGSLSGTADGFEASSRPAARSKDIVATNEAASTISRRSRKRKTFAELKEEESMLWNERLLLNKKVASLRATMKEHSARNECLKRLKLEYDMNSKRNTTAAASNERKHAYSNQPRQMEASTLNQAPLVLPTHVPSVKFPESDTSRLQKNDATEDRSFMLPDLNTTPSENDASSETLYGISSETLYGMS